MERYTVDIERDPETGAVVYETWRKDGELIDSAERPAIIGRDAGTGQVVYEVWCRQGRRHRDGAPAVITRDPAGRVIGEQWWREGLLHREAGPAIVTRDPASGRVVNTTRWNQGRWLRVVRPARTSGRPSSMAAHSGP